MSANQYYGTDRKRCLESNTTIDRRLLIEQPEGSLLYILDYSRDKDHWHPLHTGCIMYPFYTIFCWPYSFDVNKQRMYRVYFITIRCNNNIKYNIHYYYTYYFINTTIICLLLHIIIHMGMRYSSGPQYILYTPYWLASVLYLVIYRFSYSHNDNNIIF